MKTYNTFHIYENGIMDDTLANDVRNQLQCNIEYADWDETGKLEVGCVIEHKGWKQFDNRKFYYRDEKVVIGNDTFNVVSLRSYDTIVGFVWMGIIYLVGKYSVTTTKQVNDFIKNADKKDVVRYNRRVHW